MAKTKIKTKTEVVRIKASAELWESFRKWTDKQSCITLAEGFRAAMRTVQNSEVKSQSVKTPNFEVGK